ncbi:MAG TPA: nitroreductase family protein [Longimicrobiales bacterium]|nr:nitroreductase family protein [Longimicrobiales bacterium]
MASKESVARVAAVEAPDAGRVIESSAVRRAEALGQPLPEAWRISESEFPSSGSVEERLRYLIGYAVLAPSSRNAQPWRFRVDGDRIRLFADRTRGMPVADPDGRQLVIGCGAALHHLRLALRRFRFADRVTVFPDPAEPDLLAEVRAQDGGVPTEEERALFEMIRRRRTVYGPFDRKPVGDGTIDALRGAAAREGAWFLPIKSRAVRVAVASIVAAGHRAQFADEHLRHELAAWLRPNRGDAVDGIPGYALGLGDLASRVAPTLIRNMNLGRFRVDRQRELARGAPLLAVLGTAGDAPPDWLAAGQALSRVLLTACKDGLNAGYLNQALEIPGLRRRLREVLGVAGYPQLLLRFGHAPPPPPTPRRPVADVLA